MAENPKMVGSRCVDCNPQDGPCPMVCPECFWLHRGAEAQKPYFPTAEEARGKVVRVNSRHDSNLQREMVIAETARYPHRFFNTSIPLFDFPGPVMFTANGKRPIRVECPPNVMAVRVRASTWTAHEAEDLANFYSAQGVPVIVTFMRYRELSSIPIQSRGDYEWGTYITTVYQMPTAAAKVMVMSRFRETGVRMCGTPWSPYCRDCENCWHLYWDCLRKQKGVAR